ncbi:PIR Superfamily Protein [Plasmodium ovale curtisi]|uniref:PIR Superfamily Protein n=1 Tax=Plasmodium ovale curtisi TaxID=864141 RepID=A0A1A8WKR6_PLAOA|nr:PIR Superfamily Protein [Plasmodium ovale curtisi]
MEGGYHDERYDSFDEYSSNKEIYERIKTEIGGDHASFPSSVLGDKKENTFLITNDCLRLRRYLMNFHNKKDCQNKNCCQYINYFLNYIVRDLYSSDRSVFDIYKDYINHVSNDYIKSLCAPEINYMEQDKYELIKKLYNIYQYYEYFINKSRGTPICHYAKLCVQSYYSIMYDYLNIKDTKFCKALKDFKILFEKNEHMSENKCGTNIPNSLSYPDICNEVQEESIQSALSPHQQTTRLEIQKPETSVIAQGEGTVENKQDPTNPKSLGAVLPITLFSSGIGALFVFLSLYKYTPIGHWLLLRMQRFKRISKNIDGEDYEMQQHTYEYDKENSEYNGYNISYNSV